MFTNNQGPTSPRAAMLNNAEASSPINAEGYDRSKPSGSNAQAVIHRAKYTDKSKKDEMRPLRQTSSGAIRKNKMLPLRRLNLNSNNVRTSAVFNYGVARPKVRKENLPSSSRPPHLWHLTNAQYAEYVKKEKRESRQ